MKLFFWQNINSIHQSAFFRELAKNENFETTLVVTEKIHPNRIEMGWNEPKIQDLKIINLSENDDKWKAIIEENSNKDALHMFSGIHAFPKVYKSLTYAIEKKCRVGIFTEPFDLRGHKGFIRRLRGYYYKIKYDKKLEFVLTTGQIGVKQFFDFGFTQDKVFNWAYSVEKSTNTILERVDSPLRIIFAGSFIKRKGYDILLAALQKLQRDNLPFIANLFCLKEEDSENTSNILLNYDIKKDVLLHRFLPNLELRKKIAEHDILILPSRHDGWGAVVSESLAEGTPVIVSNKCGASTLINEFNGQVLNDLSVEELYGTIKKYIEKKECSQSRQDSGRIKEEYEQMASGLTLVGYFQNIIQYTERKRKGTKPISPWSKK